jgi:hypothetical protein
MNHWFNYTASLKILIYGLLFGSLLPAVFALAVVAGSAGEGAQVEGDAVAHKRPALTALSYLIYASVLVVVFIAVLYIARDFIGAHTGMYILGAKPV